MILKYRAYIDGQFHYFTLQEIANDIFTVKLTNKKSINFAPKFLMEWLQDGNQPDVFTGWVDKNNFDIYENDICKSKYLKDSAPEPFLVEYKNLMNCGDCFNDSGIGFNFYLNESKELEIIGSIHKNPGLLEKKINDRKKQIKR